MPVDIFTTPLVISIKDETRISAHVGKFASSPSCDVNMKNIMTRPHTESIAERADDSAFEIMSPTDCGGGADGCVVADIVLMGEFSSPRSLEGWTCEARTGCVWGRGVVWLDLIPL